MVIELIVGGAQFSIRLESNRTADAFKNILPLRIQMKELNGNEKYFVLPKKLFSNASYTRLIHAGDFMLYGEDTLVLFYKEFLTNYPYTRLGRVEHMPGFVEALGSGDLMVELRMR